MTSSTPLRVKTPAGEQEEKFLFYRGVSTFPVPLSAKLTARVNLLVENRSEERFPILFSWSGVESKWAIGSAAALRKDVVLGVPELTPRSTIWAEMWKECSFAQGLYQDEAHAMLETWRGSWFEEGSRLLYICPPHL